LDSPALPRQKLPGRTANWLPSMGPVAEASADTEEAAAVWQVMGCENPVSAPFAPVASSASRLIVGLKQEILTALFYLMYRCSQDCTRRLAQRGWVRYAWRCCL